MAKSSIQRRLIVTIVVSQLVLAIGLIDIAILVVRTQMRKGFEVALHGRGMSIAALVRYSEDDTHKLLFERDLVPPPLQPGVPDVYEVVVNEHTLLARSPNWPNKQSVLPPRGYRWIATYVIDGTPYRGLKLNHVPVLDREEDAPSTDFLTITYAASVEPVMAEVSDILVYIVIGSLALLAISGGFAFWALRRSLRPLGELATSAGAVTTSNWELNPPEEALDTLELAPLTEAMISMLNGLRRSFTQQREFLANAAHELKTPVAILKSTLQSLLQRQRSSDEYRAGLEEALDDMARLEKLVHSMLRLARAEQWAAGSLRRDLPPIEVAMTCQLAIAHLHAVAEQRGVAIDFSANGPIRMPADPDDLELVWSNLLENAIRFSPRGETVRINVSARNGHGIVEVADKGPGIPVSELPRIFERFHRADTSRARNTGGYGLGLAITKALVEAYGGTIEPHSRPGEGTRMIVTLPIGR